MGPCSGSLMPNDDLTRTEHWQPGAMKLVRVGKKPAELYDLAAEVGESKNLAEKDVQSEAVVARRERLDD